jgi:hypothetical protein
LIGTVLLVTASTGVRVLLALRFPTIPDSDFKGIVVFASALAEQGITTGGWYWNLFSQGTPTILSLVIAVVPLDPATTARMTTAVMLGLLPLLPLLLLRNRVPWWGCFLVAVVISFQPALVIFSSVVAQDNWVMLPVVALACLAVCNLWGDQKGYPVWAALLWCVAGYVREEMYLVALPLAIAACWPQADSGLRLRRALAFAGTAWLLLICIGMQRYAATGNFALTTNHGGASILGSYAPGAGFGWVDPQPFIAAKDPSLLDTSNRIVKQVPPAADGSLTDDYWASNTGHEQTRLAIAEILRRPGLHAVQRLGALYAAAIDKDGTLEYWALTNPSVQSATNKVSAAGFANGIAPIVYWGLIILHVLFVGAVFVAIRERSALMLVLVVTILLKIGIHVLVAMQGRFLLVTDALEALVVALALVGVARQPRLGIAFTAVASAALVACLAGSHYYDRVESWVATQEWNRDDLHYRFALRIPHAEIDCQMDRGELTALNGNNAVFQLPREPRPGDFAEIVCTQRDGQQQALQLEVHDGYAPGGLPGRIVQEAIVDGKITYRHDIARASGTGWWSAEIPRNGQAITVRIEAISPDAGAAWGNAAATGVRLGVVGEGGVAN